MEVKTITVIGAGTMGRGIAYAAALGGFQTFLQDVNEAALAKAVAWIRDALDEGMERGKVEGAARAAALGRIRTCATIVEAVRDAELIIEAVPEELEMKLSCSPCWIVSANPALFLPATLPRSPSATSPAI